MPDFANEASRLRILARNRAVQLRFTKHGLEELQKDNISRIDVQNMLRRCRVTLVEDRKGEETWRAEGADNDGRPIAVVVVAYEEELTIKIITGWAS